MASHVVKPIDVWSELNTRASGYLAAAFDGEGHLLQSDKTHKKNAGVADTLVGFTQKDNPMLNKVKLHLVELGFHYTEETPRDRNLHRLNVCRKKDLLRLLGSIRPVRLLARFNPNIMGTLNGNNSSFVRLVHHVNIGYQYVATIRTSSRTFLAEGFASHN